MLLADEYIKSHKYADHFIIIADVQTSARGRKGNDWSSEEGGLWCSLVLNHISLHQSFTLYIGLCILKSLIEITKKYSFKIKWPNDIYLMDDKVCGLICSQYQKYHKTSIGIGINTNNSKPLIENANSINNILNVYIDNQILLGVLIKNIFFDLHLFEAQGLSILLDYYQKYDFLLDKRIKVISGNDAHTGKYLGINNMGELVLRNDKDIEQRIGAGTVICM